MVEYNAIRTHNLRQNRPQLKNSIISPVFFVFFAQSLVALLLLLSFLVTLLYPASEASAANKTKKPLSHGFPIALNVTKSPVTTSVTVVPKKPTATVAKSVPKKREARLLIPSIKVNSIIKDMGVTSDGAMAVPSDNTHVGWYSPGTRPGATGSAVVGGHNLWNNAPGVFAGLDQLKIGDRLSVVDAKGVSTSFVVQGMRTYAATDENTGIFSSETGVHLNLITCSGTWDPLTKSFTTRLVVFTDAEPTITKISS